MLHGIQSLLALLCSFFWMGSTSLKGTWRVPLTELHSPIMSSHWCPSGWHPPGVVSKFSG